MKTSVFWCGFLFSAIPVCLMASDVDIPHQFSAGTPAIAAQVNENFSEVEAAVDDNQVQITAMQLEIEALEDENKQLQKEIDELRNAQPSTVAMPIFPRSFGPGTNYIDDYDMDGNKGVFTIEFNVVVDPDTFVAGTNVLVSGAGGVGSGTIEWTDNNSTLTFRTTEDFATISPCFSGGLTLTILGSGELVPQDMHGKAIDGDKDGLPGGDFSNTYDLIC
ncbi:hypothetical protein [Reinekea blandensis]|nr:hypothetical protein [Reinekea blandensis]